MAETRHPRAQGALGSLVLTERGDVSPVPRHPRFRLFGAMNPANDAGKRELPPSIKARFTELYVGETTSREDLCSIVAAALAGVPRAPVDDIVDFFFAARGQAETTLLDSAGQKPQFRCAPSSFAPFPRHELCARGPSCDDTLGSSAAHALDAASQCLVIS